MEQKEGLQNYYNKCTKQIEDIVELVRGQLTLMARITLGALIVIDVHGKEMLFYRLHFSTARCDWPYQKRLYILPQNLANDTQPIGTKNAM